MNGKVTEGERGWKRGKANVEKVGKVGKGGSKGAEGDGASLKLLFQHRKHHWVSRSALTRRHGEMKIMEPRD